jgi:long-chain acyl-CoA synthetase
MNLARIVEAHPDGAPALRWTGGSCSYGELRARVAAMRGALVAAGAAPGGRVALLCANSPLFVESWLATVGAGAAAVPLNPASPAAELQRELEVVRPHVVVVDEAGAAAFAGVDASRLDGLVATWAADGAGVVGATTASSLHRHAAAPVVDVQPGAHAALLFTSGTAGAPKAAVLTHGSLSANLDQLAGVVPLGPDDVVLGLLPMFHIFGLNVVLGCALRGGASVVLEQRFDPAAVVATVRSHGITVLPGAPPVWAAFVRDGSVPADAFATVRLALTGAAKMPEDVSRAVNARFGLRVAEGYGLTEASPVVSVSHGSGWKVGSIGRPLPGVEVRLVDEDGSPVEQGDPGEVWVRGENVFAGYLDDPAATSRVLVDGWLRTGDVAVADPDGDLAIVDRMKDLIIVSGFNVYPAEVEAALEAHPAVAMAAVVGAPDERTGECVVAHVVLRGGAEADEQAIVGHCRSLIARYKCPVSVRFVDSLPLGGTGKVLRRALS